MEPSRASPISSRTQRRSSSARPSEFLNREQAYRDLKAKYGLDIKPDNFVAISDGGGPATVKALSGGTVTAANISAPPRRFPQNKFVVLEDPKNNFLPETLCRC